MLINNLLSLSRIRYRSEGLSRADLAAERAARAFADKSRCRTSSLVVSPANRPLTRMGRWWQQHLEQDRRQYTLEQAESARDTSRYRGEITRMVKANDDRLESSCLAEEETRELGRQWHKESGVDEVAPGLGDQRLQKRSGQIVGQEGLGLTATAAADCYLAYAAKRYGFFFIDVLFFGGYNRVVGPKEYTVVTLMGISA